MGAIGRADAKDPVDEWIASIAAGRSFVDIGGIGEFSVNERCSWAQRSGASRTAMADFEPFSHHLWRYWHEETGRQNIGGIEEFEGANIDDPRLPDLIGTWDIVHSTGILYHVPNPIHSLLNIRRAARRYLILNTVVVPEVIENDAGRLVFPACSVAFFPALRAEERAVLARHYREHLNLDLEPLAPASADGAIMPYMQGGQASYYPYWWIFTVPSFEAALATLEMRVRERWTWNRHAHFVLLERE